MLFTLKTLLLSNAILTYDSLALQTKFVLSQNKMQTAQNERRNRAAKLVARSSYVGIMEDNDKLALALLQEACSLGYGRACWYYGYETEDEKDIRYAQEVLAKSCFIPSGDAYNGESCTYLGIMVSHGKADVAESEKELYIRACNLEDGWGCYRLAQDFILSEDVAQAKQIGEKALNLLSESCDNNDAVSCYFAGSIYGGPLTVDWLKDSESKYRFYMNRGCALGDGDSCYELQHVE